MDQEQAERFLAAAQQDYQEAVERYIQCVPREEVVLRCDERADVLAAHEVLELAQREADDLRRHEQAGKDYAGVCEECGRTAPRWVVGQSVNLRALCAECGRAER